MHPATTASRLQARPFRVSGGVLVRLAGVIDETLDRMALLDGIEGVVVFDLDQVTQVTSFGVREWIATLQQIQGQLFFVRCRPALVSQFNMVRGFGGNGKVVSIYLPYVCPSCNTSFDQLLDLRTQHDVVETYAPPPAECPKCKAEAEFDDIAESYLSYVAKQARPQTPPVFESILSAGEHSPASTPLKIVKEVSGSLTGLWLNGALDGKDYLKRAADGIEGALLLSMEGVTSSTPEGLDRIASFLARVTVPTTLTEIPIELADRIAIMPELADKDFGVRTVVANYACAEHGASRVSLTVAAFKQAEPTVPCPRCRKAMTPAFPAAVLTRVRILPAAKPNADEAVLLSAHSMAHTEVTSLKTPTSGQLVPGAIVMGRFRFERLLGAGGMAEVFLARQTSIGGFEKSVVIKRILPGLAMEASFVEMFLAEARVAARLVHPNVVQIYDVGRESGQHFIVMEYVNGWDVATILKACHRVGLHPPVSVAMSLIADVARGLHAAHSAVDAKGEPSPVIHRDVSPHNILVGRDGVAKITDFGIAKAADAISVTPTSIVKGKTAYLAPEVVNNSMKNLLLPSIDIFALGIVAYQLLAGVNPFRRENDVGTLTAILHEVPPLVCATRADVPMDLAVYVAKLLEKDATRRIASADLVADDMDRMQKAYRAKHPEPTVAEWLKDLETLMAVAPAVTQRESQVRVDTATIDPLKTPKS